MKNIEVDEEEIAPFLPTIEEGLKHLSRQELLTRFVSTEFNHFLNLYKDNKDLEVISGSGQFSSDRGNRRERERQPEENFTNVRLNIGRNNGFDIKSLFGLVNSQKELKGAEIGKVKMSGSFTVFGIDKSKERDIVRCFRVLRFKGQPIEARIIKEPGH